MNNRLGRKVQGEIIRLNSHFARTRKTRYRYGLNKSKKRGKMIVVSMTSFPFRFSTLHICINSLLHQTMKPDKIIVWLDDYVNQEQFSTEMINLTKYGVEYRFVPNNIKPHNKYLWVMQEFSDSVIITVDDDIIYPITLVSSLMKSYKKHPDCVSARRVHKITWNCSGKMMSYNNWLSQCTLDTKPSFDLFATGVGGVLYPPHLLPTETYDINKIRELCLANDDIWLKFMEVKNSVPVVWAKCIIVHPPMINTTQQVALVNSNVNENNNDILIGNMRKQYPECEKKMRIEN